MNLRTHLKFAWRAHRRGAPLWRLVKNALFRAHRAYVWNVDHFYQDKTVLLGGIQFDVIVENETRVVFRESWSKSRLVFTREHIGEDVWQCQTENWERKAHWEHVCRIEDAHLFLQAIMPGAENRAYLQPTASTL